MGKFDLGGYQLSYDPQNHHGANFVEILIVGPGGRFVRWSGIGQRPVSARCEGGYAWRINSRRCNGMKFDLTQEQFLLKGKVTAETWQRANVPWETLSAIAADYVLRQAELSQTAEYCANVVQALPGVHSVRWRLKDVEHLLEKIVRKRAVAEEGNKYLSIDEKNYASIVTDLVGIRALHLFKDECFGIDAALRAEFHLVEGEQPVAYVRDGDPDELTERFRVSGLEVKHHKDGYRSVHYVIATQPRRLVVAVEVQVRTIFEEGWSEIDHKIRYPNFSDNQQVAYFLRIFNGLAGSADEMGSFVRGLAETLSVHEQKVVDADRKHEDILLQLESTVAKLDAAQEKNAVTAAAADKLKREVAALRAASEEASAAAAVERRWRAQASPGQVGGVGTEAQRLAFLSSSAGLSVRSPSVVDMVRQGSGVSFSDSIAKSAGLDPAWSVTDPLKRGLKGL